MYNIDFELVRKGPIHSDEVEIDIRKNDYYYVIKNDDESIQTQGYVEYNDLNKDIEVQVHVHFLYKNKVSMSSNVEDEFILLTNGKKRFIHLDHTPAVFSVDFGTNMVLNKSNTVLVSFTTIQEDENVLSDEAIKSETIVDLFSRVLNEDTIRAISIVNHYNNRLTSINNQSHISINKSMTVVHVDDEIDTVMIFDQSNKLVRKEMIRKIKTLPVLFAPGELYRIEGIKNHATIDTKIIAVLPSDKMKEYNNYYEELLAKNSNAIEKNRYLYDNELPEIIKVFDTLSDINKPLRYTLSDIYIATEDDTISITIDDYDFLKELSSNLYLCFTDANLFDLIDKHRIIIDKSELTINKKIYGMTESDVVLWIEDDNGVIMSAFLLSTSMDNLSEYRKYKNNQFISNVTKQLEYGIQDTSAEMIRSYINNGSISIHELAFYLMQNLTNDKCIDDFVYISAIIMENILSECEIARASYQESFRFMTKLNKIYFNKRNENVFYKLIGFNDMTGAIDISLIQSDMIDLTQYQCCVVIGFEKETYKHTGYAVIRRNGSSPSIAYEGIRSEVM